MSNLRNKTIEFLCICEGYHQAFKMVHWSTSNKSEHLLTDDIDGSVLEYEDKVAEVAMGSLNTRFGQGDLKTLLPEGKTTEALLKELKGDIVSYRKEVGDDAENEGLANVLNDFLTDINKYNYLRTLK